jgi:hypothetical protein
MLYFYRFLIGLATKFLTLLKKKELKRSVKETGL